MISDRRTHLHLLPWLLFLIVLGVFGWFWWTQTGPELTILGEGSVKATPDQFVFSPSYEARAADEVTARSQATEKGDAVVTALKKLGVTESMLQRDIYVYRDYSATPAPDTTTNGQHIGTYSLSITIEDDTDLAQNVLTHLATTPLQGNLTPYSSFKTETQRRLEREARVKALEDARVQAEQTADTQNARVWGVVSIGQPTWGGDPTYAAELNQGISEDVAITPVLDKSPGAETGTTLNTATKEVTYTIEVVYKMR